MKQEEMGLEADSVMRGFAVESSGIAVDDASKSLGAQNVVCTADGIAQTLEENPLLLCANAKLISQRVGMASQLIYSP